MKRLAALTALALSLCSLAVPGATARTAQCQSTRAVFYTSNDWLQLAEGLAADPSACAQYYISIAPVTAQKTEMRPGAAPKVDALGPNFHALAEVNYQAWQGWVESTGNSWYAAGQAARASMDAAGFNVAGGDTWAVNEFPSSVLTDAGGVRANVEQLVQGLEAGDGSDPQAQGVVFMVGVGQNGLSFSSYKASLESWFQDATFWSTMSADVSDFFFEAYGDVRDYAVAGENPQTRMANLDAFLQAPLALATAPNAPATEAAARAFLGAAYGPLGNASWAWSDDYGWTQVPSLTMADYVSAQTYAMRADAADSRIGFAFNPSNGQGLDAADYASDVAGILARLAGAIHETDGGDPEQACEATGCASVVGGAAPQSGWQTFDSWTPTSAAFTSEPQTATPAAASGPIGVELETGGVPTTLPVPASVTFSSSSPTGMFAPAASGPWSSTLTLTIPAFEQTATVYSVDSSAGSPTLTANLAGALTTQPETILAPAPVTPAPPPPPPPAAEVSAVSFAPEDDRMHVALRVTDASGDPLAAHVALSLLDGSAQVASSDGGTSAAGLLQLTAAPLLQRGCYRVVVTALSASGYAWNGASPSQSDCVTTLPARVSSLVFTQLGDRMHVALRVSDESGAPLQARVRLALRLGSMPVAETGGATTADGVLGVTPARLLERGCYSVEVLAVSLPGYRWDGTSPPGGDCVTTLPAHVETVAFARLAGRVHLELRVVDDAGRPLAALVDVALLHGGSTFASTDASSAPDGALGLTAGAKPEAGCYRVLVRSVEAAGFAWDRRSPSATLCLSAAELAPAKRPSRAR